MKILIVGLGSIGQRHARNLKAILGPQAQLIAVRARGDHIVINEGMKASFNVRPEDHYDIQSFDNWSDALKENPDAAIIANPTSLHIDAALKAALAGCHLFIEKPVSDRLDGIDDLLAIVAKKKLISMIGYQLRFHPSVIKLKALLLSGIVGKITSARFEFGEYLPHFHPYEDYRISYAARKELGGGAILGLIHEIDLALHLIGDATKVFAMGGHLSRLEITAEDTADILLECRSKSQKIPVQIHLDFIQRPPSRNCVIVGDEGKIIWDYYAHTLKAYEASSSSWIDHSESEPFTRNNLFMAEMSHFLECIDGKSQPITSLEDGLKSLKVALAAKQSLTSGQPVEL